MKTKRFMRFEVKALAEDGTFEGMLSPYGNVDSGSDVVVAGAYTKTLKDRGGVIPMLWQHKPSEPIGQLELEDRPDGLWCKGKFLLEDPTALKAYRFVKAGIVKGLSIGFESIKDTVISGVRHLQEIKLYEGSVVTFPMNESALIASVKARGAETKSDFNDELAEIQLAEAGYQMLSALRSALDSLIWSDMTREEKISARAEVIQQFADADAAYFPAYLDLLAEWYGDRMETWAAKKLETKAGRTISAATKTKLSTAHEQIKSAADLLLSLIAEEAGSTTSDDGADSEKSEPVNHSAIAIQIQQLKDVIKWN